MQFSILQTDSPIKIDKRDGTVYIDGTLDRETNPVIRLSVIARDGGMFEDDQVRYTLLLTLRMHNK